MRRKQKLEGDRFDPNAFEQFAIEFGGESDRAAVVLGAAKLDYLLHQIIEKFLRPSVEKQDGLLDGNGGLSSFSSKIKFCYRVGLIDADFVQALERTRKIRNDFAHEVSGCDLNENPYEGWIRDLAKPFKGVEQFEDFKESFFEDKSGVAADFFGALGVMVIRLESLFHDIVPVDDYQEVELVPQVFKRKAKLKGQKNTL